MRRNAALPQHPDIRQQKPRPLLYAVLLSVVVAATGAYLLANQAHLPKQPLERHATRTTLTPPASWKVINSPFGYRYASPPTWWHPPENGTSEPAIHAPGATYPDGYFLIERQAGGAAWCESQRKWLLAAHPRLRQQKIRISAYSAVQLAGKSTVDDGYEYDRKTVLVARQVACYKIDMLSRNNAAQLAILNQILSTVALTD